MDKRTATTLDRADLLEARLLDEREARIRAEMSAFLARHAPGLLTALDENQHAQAAWRARVSEEYGVPDLAAAIEPETGAIKRAEPERRLAVVPDPAAS